MGTDKNNIIPFSVAKAPIYNAEAEKEANAVGTRIEEALRMRGIRQRELSDMLAAYGLQVSRQAISKWVVGDSSPNAYQLLALCHILQIDGGLEYFTSNFKPALNAEGIRKLEEYRADLIASGRYKPQQKTSRKIRYIDMPISNLSVSAGTGNFLDEENFEMVSYPADTVPDGADFGVRVSGDSMEPVYHDGQIVWVKRCEELVPGQVGIFIYDGDGYLKVYEEQEPDESCVEAFTDSYGDVHMQPVLISYNQAYSDRVIRPDTSFQIVGRVL